MLNDVFIPKARLALFTTCYMCTKVALIPLVFSGYVHVYCFLHYALYSSDFRVYSSPRYHGHNNKRKISNITHLPTKKPTPWWVFSVIFGQCLTLFVVRHILELLLSNNLITKRLYAFRLSQKAIRTMDCEPS